ncbi:MAG: polyhydroxyalkanoate synthesis repressor PhaR [Alphaproteobacteria bacterium]|nr:polyhydroxyalkanoate synthesis repressor PhaR [Alphaproteobacteria bacterium]
MSSSANESVVIKKYANRRLYNTAISAYVTLGNLAEMVKNGVEFNVYDAKNNEDITRQVLAQIIVEEEGKTGQNLLPISFLRRLIGFYGDSMQWLVPKYLEHSLTSLSKNQEQIREYFQKTFGNIFPFNNTLEQMSKQNLAMFESTLQMFSPFGMMGLKPDKDGSEFCCSTSKIPEAVCTVPDSDKKADSASPVPVKKKLTAVPTPETSKVTSQNAVSGEEVQSKIAALQRQLSELARSKA